MMLNTRGYLNIAENTETDVSDKRLFRDQKWIQVEYALVHSTDLFFR
jgi:hypothetical protein